MYHWVEDREFLRQAFSECAGIVNQLVQELKKYDIESAMKVVGSKSRNMITQNAKEPIDFDFNLLVRNADEYRDGRNLKEDVREAFNEVLNRNDWEDCDDSTSALTTKTVRYKKGKHTPFKMDVCILKEDCYGHLHRLIHQKTGFIQFDQWLWNMVPNSERFHEKELMLKQNPRYWNVVRETYLSKKNMYLQRGDHDHPFFVCYIEAVNEVHYWAQRGQI